MDNKTKIKILVFFIKANNYQLFAILSITFLTLQFLRLLF